MTNKYKVGEKCWWDSGSGKELVTIIGTSRSSGKLRYVIRDFETHGYRVTTIAKNLTPLTKLEKVLK